MCLLGPTHGRQRIPYPHTYTCMYCHVRHLRDSRSTTMGQTVERGSIEQLTLKGLRGYTSEVFCVSLSLCQSCSRFGRCPSQFGESTRDPLHLPTNVTAVVRPIESTCTSVRTEHRCHPATLREHSRRQSPTEGRSVDVARLAIAGGEDECCGGSDLPVRSTNKLLQCPS